MAISEAPRRASRTSTIIGFAVGLAVAVLAAGAWLAFGSPLSWPTALRSGVQVWQGQRLYEANCLSCHGGPAGGSIDDSPPRHNANGHTWHHPDCALRRMVRDGSDAISELSTPNTPKMLPFRDRLSPAEIDAVIAYIKTMWTPEQRQVQGTFTSEMCFEGGA